MNGNNNQFAGAYIALMLVGMFVLIAGALLFGAIVLLSAIFTIVALIALEREITLFGEVVRREEAIAYLRRGVIGAVAIPIVVLTAYGMMGARFNADYFWLLPVGGYSFGSLVVGYWIEQAKLEAAQRAEQQASIVSLLPPEPSAPPVRTVDLHPPFLSAPNHSVAESKPFRFATWDDEEELRK